MIDAIVGGFISKIINDGIDTTKIVIKNFIKKNRKQDHSTIETKMYEVVIDALNEITANKFENSDILSDSVETLLNGFKIGLNNYQNAVKNALDILNIATNELEIERFTNALNKQICKEENRTLYESILLLITTNTQYTIGVIADQNTEIKTSVNKVVIQGEQILEHLKKEVYSQNNINKELLQPNMKDYYANKWNSPLFLQEEEKKKLRLCDAFIWPEFDYKIKKEQCLIKENKSLEKLLRRFLEYQTSSNMIITGVPGMGKSSIVSWIANEYYCNNKVIILRFRDWESDELNEGLMKAICRTLTYRRADLSGKILIVDGFDEIKLGDDRERLLQRFIFDAKEIDNFKFIITTRPAYITIDYLSKFQIWLDLLPFEEDKIKDFYYKIKNSVFNIDKIKITNQDVLGIPVILYMAIMADIDLTTRASKSELYSRIFDKTGGIWSKFDYINNEGYDNNNNPMRYSENIEKFLEFLGNIAFKMFKKNDLYLEEGKDDFEIPTLLYEGNFVKILEFPIKHMFEQTNEKIEFVHRSIYEFFVAEYIFSRISNSMNLSVDNLAEALGEMFKNAEVSGDLEILKFLQSKLENGEINFFHIIDAFNNMLEYGMTFFIKNKQKDVLKCELKIFANMLTLIQICSFSSYYLKFNSIDKYIRANTGYFLDCRNLSLQGAILIGANLNYSNLRFAKLKKAKLIGASLRNANLDNADLRSTDLSEAVLTASRLACAKLIRAGMVETNLSRAILTRANMCLSILHNAHLYKANLYETSLCAANLEETNLCEVEATKMKAINANLDYIQAVRANLFGANLTGASLKGANLSGANLSEANLSLAILIGADLTGVNLDGATIFWTIFDEHQINLLDKKYNLKNSFVYIHLHKIIRYSDYKEITQYEIFP